MDYKDSICLPKTEFSMKANLAVKELDVLKYWDSINIYRALCSSFNTKKNIKKFVLHDGPPFANGVPHAGTAFNRVLKDIIVKMKWMQGYFCPFVPGWDCHGLPIEWKVEEQLKKEGKSKEDIPVHEFRNMCADFAKHWIDIQKNGFKRLGSIGDWNKPYLTMDPVSEGIIVKLLGKFLISGTIYRGEKPVYWSTVEQTALAEAEIEYKDKVSNSIYVSFPIKSTSIKLLEDASVVIWTTTPWTLPANRAISYLGDASYSIIEHKCKKIVVATKLLDAFADAIGAPVLEVLHEINGNDMRDTICAHPLFMMGYDFDVPLLDGDHVTLESGTGFVHTAPGHGLEDFQICKKHNIPVPKSVNEEGKYYDEIPLFAGMHIFEAEDLILSKIDETGNLIASSKITHSYPHSWRSKAPLIFRTTPQWFISLDRTSLREMALKEIKKVEWIPSHGYNRIKSFIENRGDWCISRQRVWGVPLPIFIHKKTGEPLKDAHVVDRIYEIISKEGSNAWYTRDPQDFLGDDYNFEDYFQVRDTVDVWFESSASSAYVLTKRDELCEVADLYLEGSDQHRGWFQHSLLVSCGAFKRAPFKAVLTHGFTVDEHGRKMSKSIGNTIDLPELINEIGADIFRLLVATSDFTEDLKIGKAIIRQNQDVYKKIRNTLRYILGGMRDTSEICNLEYDEFPELEKYILHKIYTLHHELMSCIDKYDINRYFSLISSFCNNELSSYLFDIRKDRLYCDAEDDVDRNAYISALKVSFDYLVRWLAPILTFTTDEAWFLVYKGSSIHLQTYLSPNPLWKNDELNEKMTRLKDVRKIITEALELSRQNKIIGSSLQASVVIHDPKFIVQDNELSMLEEISIVSEIILERSGDELSVQVNLAPGEKCERCWKVFKTLDNGICGRCKNVLSNC